MSKNAPKENILDNVSLDFLVIGVQKAGTTTLHNLLSKERQINLPLMKETHFFSNEKNFSKGEGWYLEQFDSFNDNVLTGEIDPEYIYFPDASNRISLLKISPKIIVILRDPIKRAYSHYKMSVRRNTEVLDFIEALEQEKNRSIDEDKLFFSINYSYISRGLYAEQIERFKKYCPNSEFLFIKFDDFIAKEKQSKTYNEICKFIGIKSRLIDEDLALKSNEAKEAKYSVINRLLWDKRKYKSLRKLLRMLLPSEALRKKIFFFLYSRNQKPIVNKVQDNLVNIPDNILTTVNDDIRKVMKITNLELSDWIR